MAKKNNPQDAVKVAEMLPPKGSKVTVGRPSKVVTGALRSRLAYPATMGTQASTVTPP